MEVKNLEADFFHFNWIWNLEHDTLPETNMVHHGTYQGGHLKRKLSSLPTSYFCSCQAAKLSGRVSSEVQEFYMK